ncbi:hypothetical protein DPMN_100487 [Dreissena polymorpha]|uniref:Uncharacterized protein n=1 Tax=Dreissena polymorpha TaxID=45954 RepID=A0A9D4LFV7_DREPO|nr:hypothetical protein DPMN_100487 [Dreissena polymorpha]
MTDNVQLKQRSSAQVSRSSVNKTGGRVLHSHREIVNRLKKTPVEERLNSDDNNNSERGNTQTTRDEKEIEIANAGLSHKTSTTEHRKSLTLNALTGRERRMSNGYGYRRSSVLSAFSDSQDFNYDDPNDGLLTDRVFLKGIYPLFI